MLRHGEEDAGHTPRVHSRRGWVHTAGVQRQPGKQALLPAMPGRASACSERTPQEQLPAGHRLFSGQTSSGTRLPLHLLSGLATLMASVLLKIRLDNFTSKLLVPIVQQGHE